MVFILTNELPDNDTGSSCNGLVQTPQSLSTKFPF